MPTFAGMENQLTHIPDLGSEFIFKTSRSSGPGGQHVNKVNTRVELRFDIRGSALLLNLQKERLLKKLGTKLTTEGILIVVSQAERSQLVNKELAEKKLYEILRRALKPAKKRKPTTPTRASVEKRLQSKKQQGEKKSMRGKIGP